MDPSDVKKETMMFLKTERKSMTRRNFVLGAAGVSAALLNCDVLAQEWPAKNIKWIVPYNPGGATDIVARIIGEALGESLKQRVIVENRPGAGGTVGTAVLAGSPADGYTMCTADNGGLYNNWYLFEKLPYNQNSFEYVAMTGRFPLVLAVNKDVPVANVAQWTEWVKKQNGGVSYGTPGIGSPHHMAMATLVERFGLKMQHIPYKGDSAAVVDLVGGQIQTMLMGVITAKQYIKDDRIKFLAINWTDRVDSLPDVSTFTEAGVPNFESNAEQGLLMPAGTPKSIVNRMNQEIAKVLKTKSIRDRLENLGMYPIFKTPEEFRAYAFEQASLAGKIIKNQNISIN